MIQNSNFHTFSTFFKKLKNRKKDPTPKNRKNQKNTIFHKNKQKLTVVLEQAKLMKNQKNKNPHKHIQRFEKCQMPSIFPQKSQNLIRHKTKKNTYFKSCKKFSKNHTRFECDFECKISFTLNDGVFSKNNRTLKIYGNKKTTKKAKTSTDR